MKELHPYMVNLRLLNSNLSAGWLFYNCMLPSGMICSCSSFFDRLWITASSFSFTVALAFFLHYFKSLHYNVCAMWKWFIWHNHFDAHIEFSRATKVQTATELYSLSDFRSRYCSLPLFITTTNQLWANKSFRYNILLLKSWSSEIMCVQQFFSDSLIAKSTLMRTVEQL